MLAGFVALAGCTFQPSGLAIGSTAGDLGGAGDLAAAPDLSAPGALDGGTDTGGAVEAGVDGGVDAAVACAYALCEDFESGTVTSVWTKREVNGNVNIDQTRVHRGAYALHLHANAVTPNNSISAHIAEQKTFPALKNGLYARAFVYLPATPVPAASTILFQLYQGTPPEGDQLDIAGGSGGQLLVYQYNSNPDVFQQSATKLPTDRWVCLEWMMVSGESRTFIDGNEVTDLHKTGLDQLSFDSFFFGFDVFRSANQPAYDLWIDDLALDGARVGCN